MTGPRGTGRGPANGGPAQGDDASVSGIPAGVGGGHEKCAETLAQLQTFIDRELNACEIETVRGHLDRCPPCKHVFRFEEHLRRLVKVRCMADLCPQSLRDQILARVKGQG
jgi:mycothiol system anti-sigma-R factor